MRSRVSFLLLPLGLCLLLLPTTRGEDHSIKPAQKPKKDLYGDPLPDGAIARLGTARFRHAGNIYAATFSPEGKTLTSFSGDDLFHVWQVSSGKELRRYPIEGEKPDYVHSCAFSADGKLLALGCWAIKNSETCKVLLYDAATGKVRRQFQVQEAGWAITALAFSPNRQVLAVGDSCGRIQLFNVTGEEASRRMKAVAMVTALAFTPNGRVLASGDGIDCVRLWDVSSGALVREAQKRGPGSVGKNSFDSSLAFSPDGKSLATGNSDNAVRLWDIAKGVERFRFHRQAEGVDSFKMFKEVAGVAFTPDGKTLAVDSDDGAIHLWEVATGKKLWQVEAHRRRDCMRLNCSIAFSPDGKTLASWGWEHAIRLWDVATGKERLARQPHRCAVRSVAFSPDGRTLATGGNDCRIKIWQADTGAEICQCDKFEHDVQEIAYSPDGETIASAGEWDGVRLWQPAAAEQLPPLRPEGSFRSGEVESVVFSSRNPMLASAQGDFIRLWDTSTHKEIDKFTRHCDRCLTISPDGSLLASGSESYKHVGENLNGNRELRKDGRIRLWNLLTRKETRVFEDWEEPAFIDSIALSRDARTLATVSSEGVLRLWEVATGKERCHLRGYHCVRFSPDAQFLAFGTRTGEVCIWDLRTGQQIHAFKGHQGDVYSVAFSADGKRIASAGADCTALVWDMASIPALDAKKPPSLTDEELDALWSDLSLADAPRAYRAVNGLARAPQQTIPFLQKRLQPAEADPGRLALCLANLDHEDFDVREQATRDLENLGKSAELPLCNALEGDLSVEAKRRIEHVLHSLQAPVPPLEIVRQIRAVETLELIGGPDCLELLERLARGELAARLTQEAKAALNRLRP
jgi:WD40 repeat protein